MQKLRLLGVAALFIFLFTAQPPFIRSLQAQALSTGATAFKAPAIPQDPIQWKVSIQPSALHAGETGRALITAVIPEGWHIYSPDQPAGGPIATSIELEPGKIVKAGPLQQPAPKIIQDPGFGMQVRVLDRSTSFGLPVRVPMGVSGKIPVEIEVYYQACNDRFCLPPQKVFLATAVTVAPGAVRPAYRHAPGSVPSQPPIHSPTTGGSRPVNSSSHGNQPSSSNSSSAILPVSPTPTLSHSVHSSLFHPPLTDNGGLLAFLIVAFLAGFAALATPCVFPMIPITVSYFAKQEGEGRRWGWVNALVYCAGIIATFTGLGLLLSALFGASGIARFAANPWINIFIAALFFALAANLMGFFEIALPAGVVNAASAITGKNGWIGTLLMGLTFTLTSFTCTVPFVGTLLVSSAGGSWVRPALGMLAFSTAFALPFFVLALFPGMLSRLPRAGSWMVAVKAFMGFLEVAAAVKFLSNADLVWHTHLLPRPVFLFIWAFIGLVGGAYLLGFVRLPHSDGGKIGPGRKVLGVLTGLAGVYCVAAVWGLPLGVFDAYVPPAKTSNSIAWTESYKQALNRAENENRRVFINFTGYTCTNCRWMEANVFPDPRVRSALANYVPVELYTDGVGPKYEQNRDLEQRLFSTVALPLYAIVDADGNPVDIYPGRLTGRISTFVEWLNKNSK